MFPIQLRAHLSCLIIAVSDIKMIKLLKTAVEIKLILVLLPANATHLIQPLDIAVFKPFKSVFKKNCFGNHDIEHYYYNFELICHDYWVKILERKVTR